MSYKLCTLCKCKKKLNFFNKNKTKKDGYNNVCRECSNSRSRRYYVENKNKHKNNVYLRNKKQTLENKKRLYDYYLENPCIDCGETDPVVLESDHIETDLKINEISRLISNNSWSLIEKELRKCVVRCANCHRRKTAKEQNWYRWLNDGEIKM